MQPRFQVILLDNPSDSRSRDALEHILNLENSRNIEEIFVVTEPSSIEGLLFLEREKADLRTVRIKVIDRGTLSSCTTATNVELVALLTVDEHLTRTWLVEVSKAANMFSESGMFCGPVRVDPKMSLPLWLLNNRFAPISLGLFMPKISIEPLARSLLPVGLNVALRPPAFHRLLSWSKSAELLYSYQLTMLSFCCELRAEGNSLIFVPEAGSTYSLPVEFQSMPAQFDRAFQYGRLYARYTGDLLAFHTSWIDAARSSPMIEYYELGMLLNLYVGQLVEHLEVGRRRVSEALACLILALAWSDAPQALARTAIQVIESLPENEECPEHIVLSDLRVRALQSKFISPSDTTRTDLL